MSYPPHPPDPNRPQDTPRDRPGQPAQQPGQYPASNPPPSFPTYGRPEPQQNPYERPQDPAAPFVPPSSPVQGPPYQGGPQNPQYPGGPQYQGSQHQGPQGGPQYQVPPQGPQYPPQYGYGYGYPRVHQVKTNGLAVAALVCGLVGIFFWITAPVAVGLGIVALVQIKRRRENGTAQAVVGLSIGGLLTLVFTAVVIFLVAVDWNEGTDSDYGSDQPVATSSASPDKVYVDDLIVGECFDDGFDEGEAVRQPCPELHDAELISKVTLPAGAYPGDAKVKESARSACRQEFTKYIGVSPDKSVRKSGFWWPDAELWKDGDRGVVCAAYGENGAQLRGSVKGTKR
ncbi:putative regulator of septum formation [Kribbella voronezhensis]|uniref:Putative regulator of septum formation n=1 Tax=Kribbella voronezhensis TaxID=2512212 RepID=A0A4R7TB45_9ACTN|nr:DUF4190 domain-containing protein [Kribbella voronezhensis]TDU89260.1 putative regulator of septum formation [Kribbella voronezhensis]